jgi:hypothetical protein
VLVFVAVTIVCTHFAINVRGYPTLTHDDLLHGFAESLLTLSNLMIAIGIAQKLKATQESLASQPERATAPQLSK